METKEFKHEFDPLTNSCVHCHVPKSALLHFDIKCSGPQGELE